MPRWFGEDHDAAVRRGHRRVLERREVVSEMHLPIDFLALVEVGAKVGEPRLDVDVAERERLAPQHLRPGLRRQLPQSCWLFCLRRSRLIFRNPFSEIVGVDARVRASSARWRARRAAGTHRRSRCRDLANGFGKRAGRAALVASLPATSRAKTLIGAFTVLVVAEHEERDAQRRDPVMPTLLPGKRGIARRRRRARPPSTSAGVARKTTNSAPPWLTK